MIRGALEVLLVAAGTNLVLVSIVLLTRPWALTWLGGVTLIILGAAVFGNWTDVS